MSLQFQVLYFVSFNNRLLLHNDSLSVFDPRSIKRKMMLITPGTLTENRIRKIREFIGLLDESDEGKRALAQR